MKKVLITGASRGIGASISKLLAESGYDVFLCGRDERKLAKLAAQISAKGYFIGDLVEKDIVQKLIISAQKQLGEIDILINNAGDYVWSPVEKTEKESIENLIKLNFQAPYELIKAVVPEMKQRKWGRVINIGSISGAVGEANASLYSGTKAGLIGITKALALELAEYGITVNVINPGWVKTNLCEKCFDSEFQGEEENIDMIPQKRFIEPLEVASLVKYLVSDSAKGMTGQSLNLCAGLSLG